MDSNRLSKQERERKWRWNYSLSNSQFASRLSDRDLAEATSLSKAGSWGAGGAVLVDGHVHLHPCFEPGLFLNHAALNFKQARLGLGMPKGAHGLLLLTESSGVNQFESIRNQRLESMAEWRVQATEEAESVLLHRSGEAPLVLVAGRQIVVREGIEILALGTTQQFPDGDSVEGTLASVMETGAIAVLPWGFGKWWGRRGRLVRQLLCKNWPAPLFLGDNGGRLWGGPRPRLFSMAEARGISVLPGTDPYPFPGQENKVGRYGFVVPGPIREQTPWASVSRWLKGKPEWVAVFGRLENLPRFLWDQVAMQLRKKQGNSSK